MTAPTLLDRLRAHHRGTEAERMAPTMVEGLPACGREACPVYDGKRCMAQGFRPESLCEPAVEAMGALLDDEDAPPPADPALLASANRMLAERVERLEAAIVTAADALSYARGYVAGQGLSAEGDVDEALAAIAEAMPGGEVERG